MLVSGRLEDKAIERIQDFINDEMRGRKSFNKILVIEAEPFSTGLPNSPAPKVNIQFQPLSDAQQKDSLFDNYDKTNREKIRSSFRLPPIFVGLTSDYTRATARESREVAEEQVFAPEREDHDFVINRLLFPAMGIKYWRYKSLAPKVKDISTMSGALEVFSRCGLTLREAREEITRLLEHPLSEIDTNSDWLDLPLQIYQSKLQHGEDTAQFENLTKEDKEALLLRTLSDIEKAIA